MLCCEVVCVSSLEKLRVGSKSQEMYKPRLLVSPYQQEV